MKRLNDLGMDDLILRLFRDQRISLVAFVAYQSIPCDHFLPELVRFEERSRFPCYVVDAMENPAATDRMKVLAVPTTVLLKGGKILGAFEGPYSAEGLARRVEESLLKT